jgi:hypothetical protein
MFIVLQYDKKTLDGFIVGLYDDYTTAGEKAVEQWQYLSPEHEIIIASIVATLCAEGEGNDD